MHKSTIGARKIARNIVHYLLSTIVKMPGANYLIRKSAMAPVKFKTRLFETTMARLAGKGDLAGELIETNCGIADHLRLLIPQSKGDLLFGRPDNHISERATLHLAKLLAARSDVFIDVGANDGLYSFSIASALGSRADIHLFEADDLIFKRVAQNLRRNNIGAHAHNTAVGSVCGKATFYRNLSTDDCGSLNTHFAAKDNTAPIEVPVITLSEYLQTCDISHACVKVDVEGSGTEVWEGACGALERIDWLIMEIIGPEWEAKLPGRLIASSGWTAYYIRDYELQQWTHGSYCYLDGCYNWLFCPLAPVQLSALLEATPFVII